uniref:Uncharacterized protein n=1 Tax=Rhizophora mucronata TaxID=61149 RepID=A0A2P2PLD2_RHIMU
MWKPGEVIYITGSRTKILIAPTLWVLHAWPLKNSTFSLLFSSLTFVGESAVGWQSISSILL